MSELRELHVTNNLLSTLPRSIGALRKIKKINVKQNNILELPTTIDRLKDIKLELEGNPILEQMNKNNKWRT
jgi:Leucine-rich repeat (LRR) protein